MIKAIPVIVVPVLYARSNYVRDCKLCPCTNIPASQNIVGRVVKTVRWRIVGLDEHRGTRNIKELRHRSVAAAHVDLRERATAGGIEEKASPCETGLCSGVATPILLCLSKGTTLGILFDGSCIDASRARRRNISDCKEISLEALVK